MEQTGSQSKRLMDMLSDAFNNEPAAAPPEKPKKPSKKAAKAKKGLDKFMLSAAPSLPKTMSTSKETLQLTPTSNNSPEKPSYQNVLMQLLEGPKEVHKVIFAILSR